MASIHTHVETFGLAERLDLVTKVTAKAAMRSATRRVTARGRTLARGMAPSKTGIGKKGIVSKNRSAGTLFIGRVYPSGPHAHIMKWQDQGTGERHKRDGQPTGEIEPQYFFERASMILDKEAPGIFDDAISAALAGII